MASPAGISAGEWKGTLEPYIYRLAAYIALTMLDDPALLALAFC